MRVAVTGAGGFIGRHLVAALADAGDEVAAVTRQDASLPAGVMHHVGDVRSEETWQRIGRTDAIVHLAALSDASLSFDRPVEYNSANALGTLVGLEAARRHGARFVLASTQRIYRSSEEPVAEDHPLEPVDPYAYSKLVAEYWVGMYHRLFGLPTVVLRFFSVYGPGQVAGGGSSGVVAILCNRAIKGDELVVYGRVQRDFTYVADVASGIRLALQQPNAVGQVFNIATGVSTSTQDLASAVLAITRSSSAIRVARPHDVGPSYVSDIAKARAELGYSPTVPLQTGLERYVDWLRGHV